MRTGNEVALVLDVADPDIPEGDPDGVAVRYATRRGPNAADDRIRDLVGELDDRRLEHVDVVTSDRALAADVRPSARVVTAKRFLARLDEAGC